ncbi:hypothetical protein R3751_16300 [Halorubrum distributum]|uniref:hypothetical protein n=1 Tax=Halorubrum distributum TaxID=29283 RepID=UPI0029553C56|nr:hypothetical protein [Halorubrum distributum]MDV7351326.1 hypothetical protein [Halorubrum distributum]
MGDGLKLMALLAVSTVVFTIGASLYGLTRFVATEAPIVFALVCLIAIAKLVEYTN